MKLARQLFAAKAKRSLGNQLQVVGVPRYDTTSTLLLANHISTLDYRLIAAAFHNTTQEVPRLVLRDDIYHPFEKEHGKLLHDPSWQVFNMARHKMFYFVIGRIFDAIPITRADSAYPNGTHSPRGYLEALRRGEDVLIFPTGKISRNGTVDYTASTNVPLQDVAVTKLMKHHADLHVAFVHLVRDPVFDQYSVTFGNSYTLQDGVTPSFSDEMGKCTSITGLQLFHFLRASSNPMTLCDAILRLRDARYTVVPNRTASEIEEKVLAYGPYNSHPEEYLGLNGDTIKVASPSYQRKSIAHIASHLEKILKV